ncbi:MAG: 7-carboxy-7-deazaguanine synthase [Myxococcales bacterium]|nr:7-carboxy-7-deazaguanine synthase [Myxococcales bacterium]
MGYTVKELFRTLQGEGANTGRVAVFCRFSGCNLWSGREQDRSNGSGGCSQWCDTDFVGTDGIGGDKFEDAKSLADAAWSVWGHPECENYRPLLVCTGGEPLLQLDEALVKAFHKRGFEVAIETNGTRPVPKGVDWVCVSPKRGAELVVALGDELKLVVPQQGFDPGQFEALDFTHRFLQPKDGPGAREALLFALGYCLEHPQWRLGLQSHKFIGIS